MILNIFTWITGEIGAQVFNEQWQERNVLKSNDTLETGMPKYYKTQVDFYFDEAVCACYDSDFYLVH